jgi:hypothetical protein
MSADSETTFRYPRRPVKYRTVDDYERAQNTTSILRGLGQSPDRDPNYIPPIPPVDLRGRDDDRQSAKSAKLAQLLKFDDATILKIAEAVYDKFEGNLATLVDINTDIASDMINCPICSHGDCIHTHQRGEMPGAAVEDYLGCTRSTRHSWLYRKAMPEPLSTITPYRWDPCVIACFHFDKKLILPNGRYNRNEHLRLVPIAAAEHERKRAATGKKLSLHMKRENAKRRSAKKSSKPQRTAPLIASAKNGKPCTAKTKITKRGQPKRATTSTEGGET